MIGRATFGVAQQLSCNIHFVRAFFGDRGDGDVTRLMRRQRHAEHLPGRLLEAAPHAAVAHDTAIAGEK